MGQENKYKKLSKAIMIFAIVTAPIPFIPTTTLMITALTIRRKEK